MWIRTGGDLFAELFQQYLDAIHHFHRVGAGLLLNRQNDGALVVEPGADLSLSTLSMTSPDSSRRTGEPFRQATITPIGAAFCNEPLD